MQGTMGDNGRGEWKGFRAWAQISSKPRSSELRLVQNPSELRLVQNPYLLTLVSSIRSKPISSNILTRISSNLKSNILAQKFIRRIQLIGPQYVHTCKGLRCLKAMISPKRIRRRFAFSSSTPPAASWWPTACPCWRGRSARAASGWKAPGPWCLTCATALASTRAQRQSPAIRYVIIW